MTPAPSASSPPPPPPGETTDATPLEGGCDCGHVRYRLGSRPLFVHCCHCRWCQRESGASFALNAMIESSRLTLLAGTPRLIDTPSESGQGQQIARCPHCHVALWSHYAGAGPLVSFVRVGTLDEPDRLPPDIHIYTRSKQPWLRLDPATPAVPEYYEREQYWPADSLARRNRMLPAIESYQAEREARRAAVRETIGEAKCQAICGTIAEADRKSEGMANGEAGRPDRAASADDALGAT